jgi:hypothetical protein
MAKKGHFIPPICRIYPLQLVITWTIFDSIKLQAMKIFELIWQRTVLCTIFIFTIALEGFAQTTNNSKLEKMPADLETDFALSALPPHLRNAATVYLLDPSKGYYIARQGTNGFVCFIARTEWEWTEFRDDVATPISYDAEGAKTILPVYLDVAAMRASGKYSPAQVKDTIIARIKTGHYKAPSRPGISYIGITYDAGIYEQ